MRQALTLLATLQALGHLRDRCLDTSRAWSEFGWRITMRLRKGLEQTVAW